MGLVEPFWPNHTKHQTQPNPTKPNQTQTEPNLIFFYFFKPNQMDWTKPNQTEPNQIKPNQIFKKIFISFFFTFLNRTKWNQTKPTQTKFLFEI